MLVKYGSSKNRKSWPQEGMGSTNSIDQKGCNLLEVSVMKKGLGYAIGLGNRKNVMGPWLVFWQTILHEVCMSYIWLGLRLEVSNANETFQLIPGRAIKKFESARLHTWVSQTKSN